MSVLRVIIVDDHPILRKGLKELLETEAKIRVVGEAGNGEEGLSSIQSLKPDVAIIDIDMPVMDGIDLARALTRSAFSPRLILLTIHKDRSLIKSMPALGVCGYVLKDSAMEEIVECVRAVALGETWLSPKLGTLSSSSLKFSDTDSASLDMLTGQELRVLALIAKSLTNREIADELFVSVRTVETHRYNICAKFEIKGSHSLLRFAAANRERILTAATLSDAS